MSALANAPSKFNPRQPFSRAEARAAGLTTEMLLSRRFHKIFWDTYVARDVLITPLLRARALIRLVPSGSYVSHHTAVELWGAAPPADGATHVTLPSPSGRLVRQGVHSHYRKHPAQTTLRKGVLISTPEQTFLDLAAVGVGLVDLVVVADGLIKAGHTSIPANRDSCEVGRSGMQVGAQSRSLGTEGCGLTTGNPDSLASRARRPS